MDLALERRFLLDGWLVDPLANRMYKAGVSHQLEPRVMQVLGFLAARAGETVRRETLISEVWAVAHISDEALSRCVSMLRAAFADDPQQPRVIQTVSKVGYRLIAPVQSEIERPEPRGIARRAALPVAPAGGFTTSASLVLGGAVTEQAWTTAVHVIEQHFGVAGTSFHDDSGAFWHSAPGGKKVRFEARIVGVPGDLRTVVRVEHRDPSLARFLLPGPLAFLVGGLPYVGQGYMVTTVWAIGIGWAAVGFLVGRYLMIRQLARRRSEITELLATVADLIDPPPSPTSRTIP